MSVVYLPSDCHTVNTFLSEKIYLCHSVPIFLSDDIFISWTWIDINSRDPSLSGPDFCSRQFQTVTMDTTESFDA